MSTGLSRVAGSVRVSRVATREGDFAFHPVEAFSSLRCSGSGRFSGVFFPDFLLPTPRAPEPQFGRSQRSPERVAGGRVAAVFAGDAVPLSWAGSLVPSCAILPVNTLRGGGVPPRTCGRNRPRLALMGQRTPRPDTPGEGFAGQRDGSLRPSRGTQRNIRMASPRGGAACASSPMRTAG